MGIFDDFTDDAEEQRRKTQAGMALRVGTAENPDQVAQQTALAKRYGLPLAVVQMSPDEFSNRARFDDAQAIVGQSPKLRDWLAADTNNAAVAHDDIKTLGAMERTLLGTAGDASVMALKGAMGLPQAFVGLADIPTFGYTGKMLDAIGLNFNESQKLAESLYSPAQQAANRRVRQADGFFNTIGTALQNPSTIVTSIGESVPQMLGGAAVARGLLGIGARTLAPALAGPTMPGMLAARFGAASAPVIAGAAGEGIIGAGSAAEQIRSDSVDGTLSLKQVASSIASGAGTGLLALVGGKLAQKFGIADADTALASGKLTPETAKQGLLKVLAEGAISEGLFEELPQSAQEQIWQNFATDRPLMEGVANAAAMGLLSGAAMGGGFQALNHIAARKQADAQQGEATYTTLQQLGALAAAGPLRERSPEAFNSFVEQLTEDGQLQEVYIDGKKLIEAFNQAGVTQDDLATRLPAVAAQITEAMESNGSVRIPTADYLTQIAGGPIDAAILPHLKTDPAGMTYTEAQEYQQSQATELQAQAEHIIAQRGEDDAFKADHQQVFDQMLGQLNAANRFTPDVNQAYASLARDFYVTTADKLGVKPSELMQRYPLKVAIERMTGGQFDQVSYNENHGFLPDDTPADRPLDAAALADLRRQATRLERPRAGVMLRITDDGQAIATGPKGTRIPQTFVRFAEQNGLKFMARRRLPTATTALNPITEYSERMPLDYRAGGALYFNEMGDAWLDRTGMTLFQASRVDQQIAQWAEGKLKSSVVIEIGKPSAILREFGVPDVPIQLRQRILTKAKDKHDIAAGELRGLVVAVQSPLAVFASKKGEGHLVVLTELPHADGNIVAMLDLNATRDGIEITDITSLHPKNAEKVGHWLAGGLLLGYEKTKGRKWLEHSAASNSQQDQVKAALTSARIYEASEEFKQGNRGAYNPSTGTIALLKGADLSTFLHELGHHFLEMTADLASQPNAPAQIRQDFEALLAWFGIKGTEAAVDPVEVLRQYTPGRAYTPEDLIQIEAAVRAAESPLNSAKTLADTSLRDVDTKTLAQAISDLRDTANARTQINVWHNLDFEEKRSYHEQFARGFEAYLFEGNAPSVELQTLFGRFRAWLINVYKSLAALNVDLTDEVRGVMGRMIASDEAIRELEQVRGYESLFKTAEAAGMTPEQYADYQKLGVKATENAIEDMERRSLRDMRWLSGAKSRALKELQNEAASKRREVRTEVSAEVWSQPVYQAWQFLTARENVEKVAPAPKEKAAKGVDPARDSLLTAIAKLGGIERETAAVDLGIHKDDYQAKAENGRLLFRKGGGMTPDRMAAELMDFGYLERDANDRWSLRELEEKIQDEIAGQKHYSNQADYDFLLGKGVTVENLRQRNGGRLDTDQVRANDAELAARIEALRMTRKDALAPDLVADMFGFSSGDELLHALADAQQPQEVIEGLTDQRMLERYGELSDPQAIERAAEAAIHNEARARFMATGLKVLTKSPLPVRQITRSAQAAAEAAIAAKKVRDLRPAQYTAAETRANKNALKAAASDPQAAAVEQRAALLNNRLARAAAEALEDVRRGVQYLKKFDGANIRKTLDADYADQIEALLERFDLRAQSNKAIDKRKTLADWLASQREMGLEPDIPQALENEAYREHYKNLTVEQFRGLLDTVKQIEHLGRLKHRLLTAADQRAYEAVRDEIAASVEANAQGRKADTRTPTTNTGRALAGLKRFFAAHRKAAMLARTLDGEQDGGPMWEYFVRNANERGDMETTMRAEATRRLTEIMAPIFKLGKMGGAGSYFPAIKRSINREARLAIALNVGNEGNLQRLLGGEGWTVRQLQPVLDTLTAEEWTAVQALWDHFESYRPQIGAKERRVYGKEPEWVAPGSELLTAIAIRHQLPLRGGYYPIKYDPAASQRAEEHADAEGAKRQLQGAYTSATTRRSFTKARAEEVVGRPLLYSLAGLYSGVQDVIHDLAWHEWLIDTNRLMRSTTIDTAIRNHYGPEVKAQFKDWIRDVAEGERGAANAGEAALSRLRQGVSAAGLGFNVVSALMQPLGITQSIARVGVPWIGRGIARYIAHPIEATREVNAMSDFMANRSRTRLRELNELRNQVQDESATRAAVNGGLYFLMMRFQQAVDVPTWWGAYEKAMAEDNTETRAIALADQAVIDSQGGGMLKDLSAVERGGPALKLFTVFYSFMNTAFNLGVNAAMSPAARAKKAADLILIGILPPMLALALKQAITPGGGDDEWDMDKLAKKLLAAQIDHLMGLMVVAREFSEAAKTLTGANDFGRDYQGPAGLRLVSDTVALAKQAHQGEFDTAFRKAAINVVGDLFGLPAAQVNRTITGIEALKEGETQNPAAVVFGYQKPR